MRLLFASSTPSVGTAWPALADGQIVCGPLQLDRSIEGQVFSKRTPPGDFDLAAVIAALPEGQRPDVVARVVHDEHRDCSVGGQRQMFYPV